MTFCKAFRSCTAIVLIPFAAAPLLAQESTELQEIVVTAQKRAENIDKIGMQVTAISGASLEAQHITGPADLANIVPSLSFTNTEYNTPAYSIRGVGYNDPSLSAAPTVSVYQDEVPLPYPVLTKHSYFDLERVEVLKGPQGTLYGENATGGAINLIAAKPTDHFEAGTDLTYGNYHRSTLDGFVSGPLAENLTARLSGSFERGDGWQQSTTRPGDTLGDVDNLMFRLILDYAANDALHIAFNVNGWNDKSTPQAGQYVVSNPQFPKYVSPGQLNQPFAAPNDTSADWVPGVPRAANDLFFQTSLRVDWTLAKDITLASITSYDNYHQSQGEDQDGLVVLSLAHPSDEGYIKTFIQELRLSVNSIENQRFIFGANYEHSQVYENILSTWGQTSAGQYFASFGFPVTSVYFSTDQTKESYAAFSNWEWDIDRVTLRAGARFTETKISDTSCEYDPNNEGGTAAFFYDVVFGGAYGAFPGGNHCIGGNSYPYVVNGVAPGAPGEYANELKQSNVPFRVGMDWRVTDSMLAYWNIAKGFKAGGYPTLAASAFRQYAPVSQESVLAYDTGFKVSLADHRVQLNAAAFYYDYTDKQILARVEDPVFGILAALENIPKSSVRGAEFELIALPFKGLTLDLSYTYAKATVDQFVGINGAGITGNFAGTEMPFSPRNQAALNVDYETSPFGNWKGDLGATVNYRSSTISVVGGQQNIPPPAYPQNFEMLGIDSYTLLNVRAGMRSVDNHWMVELWSKNVTNRYYWNNAVVDSDDVSRFAGMPRTFGITVGYKY